jgi:hypothetical protein
MKYYFAIDYYPKSKNYMKPVSVHRWYHKDGGSYTERWNGAKWVDNPNLIAVTGIGGDNYYVETTEEKAMEFIKQYSQI